MAADTSEKELETLIVRLMTGSDFTDADRVAVRGGHGVCDDEPAAAFGSAAGCLIA